MSVTVTLSPVPRLQFFDANGEPLVGGLLYSYSAGTATPLATYVDSTGTTQNSNPITLDSMGSCECWLGNSAYKLALQTAEGSPLWTVDNIIPADATYLRLDGSNGPVTGNVEFTGEVNLAGGGSFEGTFEGAPTFSGTIIFSGNPTFTGSPTFARLISLTTNPAGSGQIRLADTDVIAWRNHANTADITLAKNALDQITAPAFASQTADTAQTGQLALAKTDTIAFRNNANSADLAIGIDGSDNLTYNGVILAGSSGGSLRYSATVPVTVTNSSATVPLESVTYNMGDINAVGKTIRLTASVYVINNTGSSQSASVVFKLGALTLVTLSLGAATGVATLDFVGTITAIGASGTMEYQFTVATASVTITGSSSSGGPLTLNTTSAQAVGAVVTMGLASTDLSTLQNTLVVVIQ